MNLKKVIKKQGGMKLFRQYIKGGVLFTAISQFLLLGKDRTALEILRLSTRLKNKQKLKRRYKKKIEQHVLEYSDTLVREKSNKLWVCWFQGMEEAPELVKTCFDSLRRNLTDREIILITDSNYRDYISFPKNVQEKIDLGIIQRTHLSDLLRLELLIKYGGTWIDATVFCTGNIIPKYMLDSELFLFQCLKPGRDGQAAVISSWFITAYSNSKILLLTRELLYDYWNEHKELINYFLLHDMFQIAIEQYPEEWDKVNPFDNATPHIILLRLFETYRQDVWEAVTARTPFHKLSYKFDSEKFNMKETFYEKVLTLNE